MRYAVSLQSSSSDAKKSWKQKYTERWTVFIFLFSSMVSFSAEVYIVFLCQITLVCCRDSFILINNNSFSILLLKALKHTVSVFIASFLLMFLLVEHYSCSLAYVTINETVTLANIKPHHLSNSRNSYLISYVTGAIYWLFETVWLYKILWWIKFDDIVFLYFVKRI